MDSRYRRPSANSGAVDSAQSLAQVALAPATWVPNTAGCDPRIEASAIPPRVRHLFRSSGPALPRFCHCEIAFCREVLSFALNED